jgi:CYTH domain-containing protein
MIEREKKFLIAPTAKWAVMKYGTAPQKILQTYIAIQDNREVRVRVKGDPNFFAAELTIKIGEGEIRDEFTTDFPLGQAIGLCTKLPTICKTRYRADQFEIDIYENRELNDLIHVECEFETEMPIMPDWLRIHVVEDVTEDSRHKNKSLSKYCKPFPFVESLLP